MEERADTIMRAVYFIFIQFFVVLIGCSDQPAEQQVNQTAGGIVSTGSAASEDGISLGPENGRADSIFQLRASQDLITDSEIIWYINDVRSGTGNLRFSSDQLKKGDVLKVMIEKKGDEFTSNEIVIRNTPPQIFRARISPEVPRKFSQLTADVHGEDADEDNVFFSYAWTLNGEVAGEDAFLETDFTRGDSVTVTITPHDGQDAGKSVTLTAEIHNSLPKVKESQPRYDGKIYTYDLGASDADGDTLTYSLKKAPEGMKIDATTGILSWEVPTADAGTHTIEVLVSDSNGGEILVPLTTTLRAAKPS